MIQDIRQAYNASFSDASYRQFLDYIASLYDHRPPFRICETPVFVSRDLSAHLFRACEEITDLICSADFKARTQASLHPDYAITEESDRTLFLQMDFGVCRDKNGELIPQLIEVQGFPSLYFYQHIIADAYRRFFAVPDSVNHLFAGLDPESYRQRLYEAIVAEEDPKQVVLLEIEPRKQVTLIDFLAAQSMLGIEVKCLTDLRKDGSTVYYKDKRGRRVDVKRIFNRVIFDELMQRPDLDREFRFQQDNNVHWVGHPNWFFRISKYTMPLIESRYAPKCWFVDALEDLPEDLENYVLKPLFSFAGAGVKVGVTEADIRELRNPSNYLLQERVEYVPVIQTPDDPAKCEIRMLMLWEKDRARPQIVNNLARLSKGKMIGVKYNKDKSWVGGSVGFFQQ